MDEVRELAHAAADALGGLAALDGQSLLVPFAFGGPADEFPYRESLAGADEDAVQVGYGQCQVLGLVLLQLHVDIPQPAPDEGVMSINNYRKILPALFPGKGGLPYQILQVALQDAFFHRKAVGPRGDFAKEFSCHTKCKSIAKSPKLQISDPRFVDDPDDQRDEVDEEAIESGIRVTFRAPARIPGLASPVIWTQSADWDHPQQHPEDTEDQGADADFFHPARRFPGRHKKRNQEQGDDDHATQAAIDER
jgi:hypothetical protein